MAKWVKSLVVDDAIPLSEVPCPSCSEHLSETLTAASLDAKGLQRALALASERSLAAPVAQKAADDRKVWIQLGVRLCPSCGTGIQKQSETCNKMICRACRARFCFKCSTRLEYFNCGCTGTEHGFIDPISGELQSHQ